MEQSFSSNKRFKAICAIVSIETIKKTKEIIHIYAHLFG